MRSLERQSIQRAAPRVAIAIVGACAVTVALLLGMHTVTKRFEERDPTQYYPITEFIPAPEGRMPERPPAPQRPPSRVRIDPSTDRGTPLQTEAPQVDESRLSPPPLLPEPTAAPRDSAGNAP